MKIRYLHRGEIQTDRWNEVVRNAAYETLYPYSWYLDYAATGWSALVTDDYRNIMPLVWKRKFGMAYLYQPFYTQQLGVFGRDTADPHLVSQFLHHIPARFRMGTIQFNAGNLVGEEPGFKVDDRMNFILPLTGNYDQLYANYSTNTKRNLKRSRESETKLIRSLSLDALIDLKRKYDPIQRSKQEYAWMHRLFASIKNHSHMEVFGLQYRNELVSSALFSFSGTRAIYLLSVSSEKGMETRGMFRLIDQFIRDHAGSSLVLDFEGSNLPNLARFFGGFGAVRETYQSVRFSRFPASLKKTM